MFNKGEMVVYGSSGVCRVDDITKKVFGGEEKPYYVLRPVYNDCVIYAPVGANVFMRSIITRDQAEKLIEMIPDISAEAYQNTSIQQLAEHYESALRTHKCSDLIELIMSIYEKKKNAEEKGRKMGVIDERFMKQAEELLYGEFAVALGLKKGDVRGYIAERVAAMEKSRA